MMLYADDTVLMGELEESLQRIMSVLNRICEKRKLRISDAKNKVMRVGENGLVMNMRIRIWIEEVKQVR